MKKAFLILFTVAVTAAQAQIVTPEPKPQISVSGEGKVKVVPDQAFISIAVENKGNNATEVKKLNDETVEKVVQYLKKKLPKEDVQTQRVSLNPQYDYDKKKYNYLANQTIEILLKDLSQYDALMEGLVNLGINRINNVEFRSSKLAFHQSEARKLAMQEAKLKAQDYVSVLGQKVGKALMISDNSQVYHPQPVYYEMAMNKADAVGGAPRETLAAGEINIVANVQVSFILE
ncbi:SIMPL domain-containing protein [Flavobacterium sp.]|uniref:SIMPL domain-containing protein n=1 Tax=Flavobacterium sp. TaxID=239 RepID=UPI0039E5862B